LFRLTVSLYIDLNTSKGDSALTHCY